MFIKIIHNSSVCLLLSRERLSDGTCEKHFAIYPWKFTIENPLRWLRSLMEFRNSPPSTSVAFHRLRNSFWDEQGKNVSWLIFMISCIQLSCFWLFSFWYISWSSYDWSDAGDYAVLRMFPNLTDCSNRLLATPAEWKCFHFNCELIHDCVSATSRLSISLFTVKRALTPFDLSKADEGEQGKSRSERNKNPWRRKKEVERDKNFLINFMESHTLFMIAGALVYRVGGIYEITYVCDTMADGDMIYGWVVNV